MSKVAVPASEAMPVKNVAVSDVVEVLARRNPKVAQARIRLVGKAAAAIIRAVVRLPDAQQLELSRLFHDEKRMQSLAQAILGLPATKSDAARAGVETSVGAGLGQRIDRAEGLKRVAAYAHAMPIEKWAGRVVGAGELETKQGIPRSTLHEWRRRGAVIGLLKGERKHVYPVEQFIDGRPIEGMARLTKVVADPRAAWLWLCQPHGMFDEARPLDQLKEGHVDEVIEAAERDFG